MTGVAAPSVWALFDRHDQDAAIAATLGLRRAANEHRCAGRRRDANELDELADALELIVEKVRAAYREAHPPGERTSPPPLGTVTGSDTLDDDDRVKGDDR